MASEPKEDRVHFLVLTDVCGDRTYGVVAQYYRPLHVGVPATAPRSWVGRRSTANPHPVPPEGHATPPPVHALPLGRPVPDAPHRWTHAAGVLYGLASPVTVPSARARGARAGLPPSRAA